MDEERRNSFGSKESIDNPRRNSRDNTEYVPTRCRITKPIPPKPATNPMQFVKIGPCELYRKAQEQLKKVEEVKSVRPEIRDEAEDWQANLDNWKSSRRKRQEHIIERVVEVKKYEQQELEKGRRKSKTFNEILEERSKRKTKLSISLYENDDPNDLSDYGIGGLKLESGTSKSGMDNINDNTSETSTTENIQEFTLSKTEVQDKDDEMTKNTGRSLIPTALNDNYEKVPITSNDNCERVLETINDNYERVADDTEDNMKKDTDIENNIEEPTYESAIQSYRTRVISKTNLSSLPFKPSNNNINDKNDDSEVNTNANIEGLISKGSILKRKELFENSKMYELNHSESSTSRRLSEDFINSQSLKERLLSLEKYTDQSMRHLGDTSPNNSDVKNNNTSKLSPDQFVCNRVSVINHLNEPVVEECEESTKSKSVICNNWPNKRFDSPEHDVFVNKQIHRSLDNLTDSTNESIVLERVQSLEGLEYCHSNYPASNSSTELLAYGDTDREDSGIHTADVSCSVSQADEPVDDVVTEEETKRPTTENAVYPLMQFDGVFTSEEFPLGPPVTALEPPKEKPPPPPVAELDILDLSDESELKRINSTKRIKKEIRMKRSSFLGIDPDLDDQPELEASIRKPPDINSFLQRESRLEKQIYKKSQPQPQTPTQSNYSEAGDSQDSGVELERGRLSSDMWSSGTVHTHSRQNSEPCTTNSLTSDEDEITKKEREIIELVEKEEKWRDTNDFITCSSDHLPQEKLPPQHQIPESVPDYITSEDDEHSEVLRVEHELLQLEREELERQRENMMLRENRTRMQSKMCIKNKGVSLEDISGVTSQSHGYMNPTKSTFDYRKSMPELQREVNMITNTRPQPAPRPLHLLPRTPPARDMFDSDIYPGASKSTHPMSRHSLQMLSAAPRSRLMPQDNWIHSQHKPPISESRDKFNYNQHWLIQEAEERRLSAQPTSSWKLSHPEKHLPDSIIQTLTQRVQNKMNLPDRNLLTRNVVHSPHSVGHALPIHHPHFLIEDSPDKMLSVSGKKKCSYCGNELGRGAAMIIESLCLFYHMDCFKCCVCHVQLGDGLMGTDVRVRNNKLHCHNCYSSDDGVKFSCV